MSAQLWFHHCSPVAWTLILSLSSWSEEHPKAWLSVAIVKAKIVKYSQFHFNNSFIDASMGLSVTPYDGAASMWVKSMEDLLAVKDRLLINNA